MSEVRTIPSLRFSEFDNQNIYTSRLGDIAEVRDGTHDSPKYVDKGYPLITSKNLNQNGTLSFDNINFISEHDFLQINKRSKVDVGDILFGMIGTIGNPVRINSDGFAIKNVALIKEKLELQNNFLLYYLNSHNIQKQFYRENAGGTQKFIALNLIRNLSINHPSLSEQQKIADFLTAVDKRIELLEKKKTLLETYKKGVMKKIFSQEIRFKDDNGNDFPDWEEKRLGEISNVTMGQSPNSSSYNQNGIGVPLIQGNADIQGRKTHPRQWTTDPTKLCDVNDLILSVRAPVGQISISNHKGCIGRGVCSIKSKKGNSNSFLYQFLLWFEPKWKSLEQGSTFTSVNSNDIKSIKLNNPIQLEQVKISEFLSSIDIQIELLDTQIDKSKTWKKGLLQKMFV